MIKRSERRFDTELRSMLEQAKVIRQVPPSVRARALARARDSLWLQQPMAPVDAVPAAPRGRRLAFAMAATVVLAVGSAGAVVALRANVDRPKQPNHVKEAPSRRPGSQVPTAPAPPEPVREAEVPAPPAAVPPTPSPSRNSDSRRHAVQTGESYEAELRLLHQAQTACSARDFAGALAALREHHQRFPSGRLAEQREALRVRALSGAGREVEAGRAADDFAARFPRSVLAPRLRDITAPRMN